MNDGGAPLFYIACGDPCKGGRTTTLYKSNYMTLLEYFEITEHFWNGEHSVIRTNKQTNVWGYIGFVSNQMWCWKSIDGEAPPFNITCGDPCEWVRKTTS